METWETLTMSRKDVPRAGLLTAALASRISNAQGALAKHIRPSQSRGAIAATRSGASRARASRVKSASEAAPIIA